jgi:hypothetical protein
MRRTSHNDGYLVLFEAAINAQVCLQLQLTTLVTSPLLHVQLSRLTCQSINKQIRSEAIGTVPVTSTALKEVVLRCQERSSSLGCMYACGVPQNSKCCTA